MSFAWPFMLALLVLIPVGMLGHRAIGRRRARRAGALSAPITGGQGVSGRLRSGVPASLFVLALVVMVVALARPQGTVALPVGQGIVVLAFDVSGSMAATDETPTRMDVAKAVASDLVAHQPAGIAVGIVAFSDSGITVQAPSTDQAEVLSAIKQLAPQKGTALGQGIQAALHLISITEAGSNVDYYTNASPDPAPTPSPAPVPPGSHSSAAVMLFTDGENNERPDPLAIAQQAADAGVRVSTVAIGTASGADLDLNGFHVHSQLDEGVLQQIATLTTGTYYATDAQGNVADVFSAVNPVVTVQNQTIELTGLFAGGALVLVVLGTMASLAFLGRLP